MIITLQNTFHNTTARVRPVRGRVSAQAYARAVRKLCGMSDCTCGGIRGPTIADNGASVDLQEISWDGDSDVVLDGPPDLKWAAEAAEGSGE